MKPSQIVALMRLSRGGYTTLDREGATDLLLHSLIADTHDGYDLTPRGRAMVKALCSLPMPVLEPLWTVPGTDLEWTEDEL